MTRLALTLLAALAMHPEPAVLACGAWYAVSAPIVRAIIGHESGGKTTARKGSHRGLMQLKARYAKVPPWALHVPAVGVCEGTRHLARCRAICGGSHGVGLRDSGRASGGGRWLGNRLATGGSDMASAGAGPRVGSMDDFSNLLGAALRALRAVVLPTEARRSRNLQSAAPHPLQCSLAYYACGTRALTAECGQGFADTIQRRAR